MWYPDTGFTSCRSSLYYRPIVRQWWQIWSLAIAFVLSYLRGLSQATRISYPRKAILLFFGVLPSSVVFSDMTMGGTCSRPTIAVVRVWPLSRLVLRGVMAWDDIPRIMMGLVGVSAVPGTTFPDGKY